MSRHAPNRSLEMGPYKMQEFPATELAAALGLFASDRNSFDYAQTLALKERLTEVCTCGAIRFGLPDQARKHIGDAIGLPNDPVLRYPHRELPIDPRFEALTNALRFPPPGDLPLVHLAVLNTQELQALKDSLPSLVEDLGLQRQARYGASPRSLFSRISRDVGDALVDHMEKVRSFGDCDTSAEGYNRAIARNTHRQMRIYLALGPEWTLVNSLENLALVSHTLPAKPSMVRTARQTNAEPELHPSRRNITNGTPTPQPIPAQGLSWLWVKHEGRHLPPAWGGPQEGSWGRWEPQFPDTDKPNTSLFGHSSVYLQIDLEHQTFRDPTMKRLLTSLRKIRTSFEASRRDARRDGAYSEHLETILTSRMIKRQDEALDAILREKKPS